MAWALAQGPPEAAAPEGTLLMEQHCASPVSFGASGSRIRIPHRPQAAEPEGLGALRPPARPRTAGTAGRLERGEGLRLGRGVGGKWGEGGLCCTHLPSCSLRRAACTRDLKLLPGRRAAACAPGAGEDPPGAGLCWGSGLGDGLPTARARADLPRPQRAIIFRSELFIR